jgi:hypothetical protein
MLRLIVGVDESSKLTLEEITEQLACYYVRESFSVIRYEEKTLKHQRKNEAIVKKLREQFPQAELWVGVSGGIQTFPTPEGLRELQAEEAGFLGKALGKGRRDWVRHVLLAPDLNLIFQSNLSLIEEELGIEEGGFAKNQVPPLEGLINVIRIDLGDYVKESSTKKH